MYDKYAMFLHGNNGLSRVEGSGTGKILVIKDSYANSFVPYLTANYAAIDVVDFRNYNYGLDQLIAANDYDQILVLYSYASFTTDPYLYRDGRGRLSGKLLQCFSPNFRLFFHATFRFLIVFHKIHCMRLCDVVI